jgi:hypothetical protein
MVFALRLRTTRSILIKTALRSALRRNRRCVIHGVLTRFDPNPHAIPCNSGQCREQKTLCLCGICKPLQLSVTTDRALVAVAGKRFESARRLSILPAKPLKTKSPRHEHRALCQQYVSSRVSQSLVPCIGLLRVVATRSCVTPGLLRAIDRSSGLTFTAFCSKSHCQ